MSSARWVMVLGLLGASGCGGIPIVSGDPFVPDAGEEREADVSATTDLAHDADPMDARDANDAGTFDANDSSTLDANDGADSDQPEVRGVDAPLAEVSRAEVFVNDSAAAVDIELPADDSGTPCALCMRGSGSAQVCCSARCRDLQTDKFNCGACGVVCPGTDDCVGGISPPVDLPHGRGPLRQRVRQPPGRPHPLRLLHDHLPHRPRVHRRALRVRRRPHQLAAARASTRPSTGATAAAATTPAPPASCARSEPASRAPAA